MLLALFGCTCAPARVEATARDYPSPQLRNVTTRFTGQEETELDPEAAFAVARRCPVISRAELAPETSAYARLTLRGSGLDRVVRIGGALPDGHLVDLAFDRETEALGMPVLAPEVEIWLGIREGDRVTACRGPGYSVEVAGQRLR